MHFVGLVSRCTGTRMQTRLRDQLELLAVPRQQQAAAAAATATADSQTDTTKYVYTLPSSPFLVCVCVCGVPSSLLTALQGGIDVDSGFMNP